MFATTLSDLFTQLFITYLDHTFIGKADNFLHELGLLFYFLGCVGGLGYL
jgi:hypothetical protein